MIIKVCGMRDPENISRVETLGIDLMGFIFYAASPRCIPAGTLYADAIRQCKKTKVGVFVNDTMENIQSKADTYQLDRLQLHGQETPEFCSALNRRGYHIIKAFPVATADDLQSVREYAGCVDYFLFDTRCAGYGGSGRRFDWSLLDGYHGNVPFLLSGGLAPGCESDIRRLNHIRFAGIDLNSGFESSPAVKDVERLRLFMKQLSNM